MVPFNAQSQTLNASSAGVFVGLTFGTMAIIPINLISCRHQVIEFILCLSFGGWCPPLRAGGVVT